MEPTTITPLWQMTAPWAVSLAGNSLQSSPNKGNPDGNVGDLDLCEGGNLDAPTVRIWTKEAGWLEIPLATRFLSGEWHPDMERLSPAGCRDAAFFAHSAAFPAPGNNPLPGGPAEALARLMAGDWDDFEEDTCVFCGKTATVNGACGWDATTNRPVSEPRCRQCDDEVALYSTED